MKLEVAKGAIEKDGSLSWVQSNACVVTIYRAVILSLKKEMDKNFSVNFFKRNKYIIY